MGQPTDQEFVDADVPQPSNNNPSPEDGVQDLSQDPDVAYDEEGRPE